MRLWKPRFNSGQLTIDPSTSRFGKRCRRAGRLAATSIASFQNLSKLYKFRPDCLIKVRDISVNTKARCDRDTPLASGIR